MKPTDISQLIADLRNYQTTLDENVVICDRRAVDGSAEIMLALAAHIAMMEDRICTHPPAPDATRGDPVARLIAHMKTIEPDEETAGCPATWADFIQILEGIAEAGEPFNG